MMNKIWEFIKMALHLLFCHSDHGSVPGPITGGPLPPDPVERKRGEGIG